MARLGDAGCVGFKPVMLDILGGTGAVRLGV